MEYLTFAIIFLIGLFSVARLITKGQEEQEEKLNAIKERVDAIYNFSMSQQDEWVKNYDKKRGIKG
jgi:hypothetical protein